MFKKNIIHRLIAKILIAAFIAQDIAWADPGLFQKSKTACALQVPSMLQGPDEKILLVTLEYLRILFPEMENFRYRITCPIAGLDIDLKFHEMRKSGDSLIVPCAVADTKYDAVIIHGKPIVLRRPGEKKTPAETTAIVAKAPSGSADSAGRGKARLKDYVEARTDGERKKIIDSMRSVSRIDRPVRAAFIMPMYKEEARLKPKSADNPFGEDAFRDKVEELIAMERLNPYFKGQLICVDDGTPGAASAKCAAKIWADMQKEYEEIGERLDPLMVSIRIITPEEKIAIKSRKGGAVLTGLRQAASEKWAQYIGYIDTDTSIRGQLGNLLAPLFSNDCDVAIGS